MRISIVTSTFNAVELLPFTIKSLKEQVSTQFEWVVVDGASTDGTVELINAQSDSLDIRFISEPDEGIYDAWNKACELATGDWLLFLGAGDTLASSCVIDYFLSELEGTYPSHTLVYGNMVLLNESNRTPLRTIGCPWSQLKVSWEGGRPCLPMHPALFQHRTLFSGRDSFDVSYKIAGDSVFLLKHVFGTHGFNSTDPLYIDKDVSHMLDGGVSAEPSRLLDLRAEVKRSLRESGITVPWHVFLYSGLNRYCRVLIYMMFGRDRYLSIVGFIKQRLKH